MHQSLYYLITDAAQDTGSYREFANGAYLTTNPLREVTELHRVLFDDLLGWGGATASPDMITGELEYRGVLE